MAGVPAVVEALQRKQIECRVYTKEKFHAKAFITHAKQSVVGSSALVGSSNFTVPGLVDNVRLNVQLRREVEILQEWYERHWKVADDITSEILKTIERHTALYSPFDVYARSLPRVLPAPRDDGLRMVDRRAGKRFENVSGSRLLPARRLPRTNQYRGTVPRCVSLRRRWSR